jgi:pimeloyl-ACP methyl ester carboxylesterase
VGHSFGGLNVRLFARRHPEAVAGLVLVDASHEDQWLRHPAEVREELARANEQLRRAAERAERGEPSSPIVTNLPPEVACRPAWHRTLYEESRSLEDSAAELRAGDRSLRVPLVVISAGRQPRMGRTRQVREELRRLWGELQSELCRLSPQGTHVVAAESGHYVHRAQPELVVGVIEDMVRALRGRVLIERPRS